MSNFNSFVNSLESRRLMSANSFVDARHVLHVRGFDNLANTITVGLDDAGTGITISATAPNRQGGTKTLTNTIPDAALIKKVVIVGGHKNDTITIDESKHPFAIKCRIEGRGGDDTINAGSEVDVILGGYGNDTINAGDGDDFVHGGRGNDSINGGNGNDNLWGGFGDDAIDGSFGDDKLGGVLGKNTLEGGAGSDTYFQRAKSSNTIDFTQGEDNKIVIVKRANDDSNEPAGSPDKPL